MKSLTEQEFKQQLEIRLVSLIDFFERYADGGLFLKAEKEDSEAVIFIYCGDREDNEQTFQEIKWFIKKLNTGDLADFFNFAFKNKL